MKIFNKLIDKRRDEILELTEKINYEDLMYHFKIKNICENSFNDFDNVFKFFKNDKRW